MLETLTIDSFKPLVDSAFEVAINETRSLQFVLTSVKELAPATEQRRAAFSLIFHGPAEPILAQQIVPLQSAALGTLSLFMVPLGVEQTAAGGYTRYEVIFT